jgi:hypothetical protein
MGTRTGIEWTNATWNPMIERRSDVKGDASGTVQKRQRVRCGWFEGEEGWLVWTVGNGARSASRNATASPSESVTECLTEWMRRGGLAGKRRCVRAQVLPKDIQFLLGPGTAELVAQPLRWHSEPRI